MSKLARALGRTRLGGDPPLRTSTALGAVLVPLRELVDSCVDRDPAARADAPDAVHRYRVDVRRVRALLASTRDVLDREVGEALRRRLHRLQTELEPARDAEVRREEAEALIESGVDDPDGLLRRYVVARAEAEHPTALAVLRPYLSSPGYLRLLDELDALVARPPLVRRALQKSAPVLRRDLLHQARRASRRLDAADETDLETLHDGRKAVRRVRYLAEALTTGERPLFGDLVAELASAAKALQDELGDARDAELHAERLDALAAEAVADGHDPAPILEGARRERATAAELLSRVPEARRTFDAAHAAVRGASAKGLRAV